MSTIEAKFRQGIFFFNFFNLLGFILFGLGRILGSLILVKMVAPLFVVNVLGILWYMVKLLMVKSQVDAFLSLFMNLSLRFLFAAVFLMFCVWILIGKASL